MLGYAGGNVDRRPNLMLQVNGFASIVAEVVRPIVAIESTKNLQNSSSSLNTKHDSGSCPVFLLEIPMNFTHMHL